MLFLHERFMKDEHKCLLLMASFVASKKESVASKQNAVLALKSAKYFTR